MSEKTKEQIDMEFGNWLNSLEKEHNINKNQISRGTGISRSTLYNYYNDKHCRKTKRRKIESYVYNRICYSGYTLKSKENFRKLLSKAEKVLDKGVKEGFTQTALGNHLGYTPDEISCIFKGDKPTDVREQYAILNVLHQICFDSLGLCIPEYKDIATEIHNDLNDGSFARYEKFADLLDSLLSDKRCGIGEKELTEAAEIFPEDMKALRTDNNFQFDYERKRTILRIIRNNFDLSETGETTDERLRYMLVTSANFIDGCSYNNTETCEHADEFRTFFMELSTKLQSVILEYSDIFYVSSGTFTDVDFWEYTHICRIPEELGEVAENNQYEYIGIGDYEYVKPVMELFRLLTDDQKGTVFKSLSENLTAPLPFSKTFAGCGEEYFSLVSDCYKLSQLTKNKPLAELYANDNSVKKSPLENFFEPNDGAFIFNKDEVEGKLKWTSEEWSLYALMRMAFHNMYNLNPIVKEMYDMGQENKKNS